MRRQALLKMLNRLRVWLISLWVLAGAAAGMAFGATGAGASLLGGLAGGLLATGLLAVVLRAIPMVYAWEGVAGRLGIGLTLLGVSSLFWVAPLIHTGFSINAEPMVLDVNALPAARLDGPRFVHLKGRLDDRLAIEHRFEVRTQASNKSTIQSESRRVCRMPLLAEDMRVAVVTDDCPPFSAHAGSYATLLTGILYPVCRDQARTCHEGWSFFADADSERLRQMGYRLNDIDAWVLRVGETPAGRYWGPPLAIVAVAMLLWTGLVLRAARFARTPARRVIGRVPPRQPVHSPPPTGVVAPASAPPSAPPLASPDPGTPATVDMEQDQPGGPATRLFTALGEHPATCRSLDLCADWDSYKQEPPLKSLSPRIAEFTELQSLNLMWNALTDLPPEFSGLSSLSELNLSGNPLETLPNALRPMRNLTLLAVKRCRLGGLPEWIGELSSLENLDVSDNRIEYAPESITTLAAMRHLNLSENLLGALPTRWDRLSSLEFLDISKNRLTVLPEAVLGLPQLRRLIASGNKISRLPGMAGLGCHALQELDLDGNDLGEWPLWLSALVHLETLRVTTSAPIPDALGEMPQLRTLKLHTRRIDAGLRLPASLRALTLTLASQEKILPIQFDRQTLLESIEITVRSAALLPDTLFAMPALRLIRLHCEKLSEHQQQRIKALKPSTCRVEIHFPSSRRTLEL